MSSDPYESIPADRFYDLALSRIRAAPHVELRPGTVARHVKPVPGGTIVETDGGDFTTRWCFDARPPRIDGAQLFQRFLGREIEADRACFDPNTATIMDFRVDGRGAVHFMYVLPTSPRTALVEDTWFAKLDSVLPSHQTAIDDYLSRRFGAVAVRVLFEESGTIPLDPGLGRPWKPGAVIPIGTASGAVKPSSGYAFLAIQRQADAIALALRSGRSPAPPPSRSFLAQWMDGVFLSRLRRDPDSAVQMFNELFRRCPPERLVRFLGDQGRPADYLSAANSLPKLPMAAEALRYGWGSA